MDKFVCRREIHESPEVEGSSLINENETSTSGAKKRKICNAWFNEFGEWLAKKKTDSGEDELFCKICHCLLKVSSGKADLINHKMTKKHTERSRCIAKNQTTLDESFRSSSSELADVRKLELQLCAFITEHNLPFSCADYLNLFILNCIPDSKLAKKISCSRTKTTCIIKNVLGRTQSEYVCSMLQKHKFSLCVDESTDISNAKSLCIVVRICLEFNTQDFFFGLIHVEECDARSIYKCIANHFSNNNICYKKNLIGFAADGAANMTGKHLSVAKLLKYDIPHLFIVKCVCHSIALCSSYSCLKLPSSVESLVRDVYNYISNSPKRSAQFVAVSRLLEYKPKKMLHPAQTRWLSLEQVVNRVLELYEPLKIYFSFAVNVDYIDSACAIYNNLNDLNELYLSFLKYILHTVNNVNKIFQSKSSQIQNMYSEMFRLYRKVLDNFIQPEFLGTQEICELNFEDCQKFLKNEYVYLGMYVRSKLSECKLSEQTKNEFISNCIAFYVELCEQIQKRFDFRDSVLKELSFMDPRQIIKKKTNSLSNLINHFPNVVDQEEIQDLDDEFRELRLIQFEDFFDDINTVSAEEFWSTISKIKRADAVQVFPTLSKFVSNLMCLPNSSANVERIFSKVNMNKTKYRNRLDNVTLEGILYTQK